MKISKSFKNTILATLFFPMVLFILGIYNGVMQVLYRSGILHQAEFLHINYYKGLTMHGVINAIVLTTFFAVAFGHAIMAFYLKREPIKWTYRLALWLMIIGTLMDAYAMFMGQATVLYTFYAPLKASPIFYLGTAILVIGSWVAYFGWVKMWFAYKKVPENKDKKMPLAVVGNLVNGTIWFTCSLPVAYSILVLLTPWSLGWTDTINIPLTRTLFWMFGHPLVYFWLLPAYICYYTILPKIVGSKLYSENAGRLVFCLFLILSICIGVHHQLGEATFSPTVKMYESFLTFAVIVPSFLTAFTIAASLEYGARQRGNKSLLGWMIHQPYFRKDNYLVSYLICGLIIFIFGGLSGIVNASYSLNAMVHNTAWVPGHFHMTVAGPVLLAILGMSVHLYSTLSGKEVKNVGFVTIVPYMWMLGILFFSHGLMAGGLMGEPRRTNMGMSYTDPNSPLYNSHFVLTSTYTLIGGLIMGVAALLYFIAFFRTALSKSTKESVLELPVAEPLHAEKPLPWLYNLKPWMYIMVILILVTYIPAICNVMKYSQSVKQKYDVESPVNLIQSKDAAAQK